jgi:peptidoglycan hydrolase CwlO-like protein
MNIQLIQGEFNSNDAMELITQMVHVKIKYHENKINSNSTEEDIKNREAKIKRLQKELFELRKTIHSKTNILKVEAIIKIE